MHTKMQPAGNGRVTKWDTKSMGRMGIVSYTWENEPSGFKLTERLIDETCINLISSNLSSAAEITRDVL